MKRLLNLTMIAAIATVSLPVFAQTALEAASAIEGVYEGEWTMYRLEGGVPVVAATWTDVMTVGPPIDEPDRAFVEATDVMTFADGTVRTIVLREGFLKVPGTDLAGDRYYQLGDTMAVYRQLSPHDWVFRTEPSQDEMWGLGLNPEQVVSASHVTTKSMTEDGTHHITRLTTVLYNDDEGTESVQFVSLRGTHRRVR
jgi:hypothetical protein